MPIHPRISYALFLTYILVFCVISLFTSILITCEANRLLGLKQTVISRKNDNLNQTATTSIVDLHMMFLKHTAPFYWSILCTLIS